MKEELKIGDTVKFKISLGKGEEIKGKDFIKNINKSPLSSSSSFNLLNYMFIFLEEDIVSTKLILLETKQFKNEENISRNSF